MKVLRTNMLVRKFLKAGCLYLTTVYAIAGPPIAFDGFTVNSGNIIPTSGACADPDGGGSITIVCAAPGDESYLVDDGMLQRQITVSGYTGAASNLNGTYIQFVLTDSGVTGDPAAAPFSIERNNLDFVGEDFVKMNNRVSGIASKQTIVESTFITPTLEDRFFNETNYEFGDWANNNAIIFPWVNLVQEISQVDYSADPLNPTQKMSTKAEITSNGNGFNDNIKVELSQEIDMALSSQEEGAQGFKYVSAVGQYQFTSNPSDPMLPGGTNNGTVIWNPNEKVKALWIGQTIDQGGTNSLSTFGLTQYSADTFIGFPVTQTSTLTSFSDTTAVNWDLLDSSIFGSVPTLPVTPMNVAPSFATTAPDAIAPTIPTGSAPVEETTPVVLPIAYYEWTVTDGEFTVDPCADGVVCGSPIVNKSGVFQREVTVGGITYMQTIIADTNATGDPNAAVFDASGLVFKSENFVQVNSTLAEDQGIASSQVIAEEDLNYLTQTPGSLPLSAGQFAYSTELKTGWANGGPLDSKFTVDMRLVVPDYNFANVSSSDYMFKMAVGATQTDSKMEIRDAVGTVSGGGNGFASPVMFALSRVTGAFQEETRTDVLFPITGVANIDWSPYEAIQATWIGGEYITTDPAGISLVSTLSYTNLSTGERASSTSITTSPPDPESWVNPFDQPIPSYSADYIPDPF